MKQIFYENTFWIYLIIIISITISIKCDSSNPAGATTVFDLNDLIGSWDGTITSSKESYKSSFNIDSTGKLSGVLSEFSNNGFHGKLTISISGEVTDTGSFWFISGGQYITALAFYNLQMNNLKRNLTGEIYVTTDPFFNMEVNLTKND